MGLRHLVERLLALMALGALLCGALLYQTTGAPTPCEAVYRQAQPHIAGAAKEVVEACVGKQGEGGLGALMVEFGLALGGQSREKLQRQIQTRMDEQIRADLLSGGQGRCTVLLLEGLVGRSNGGPSQLVVDHAAAHRAGCRGDP